jgi:hypothetical protein
VTAASRESAAFAGIASNAVVELREATAALRTTEATLAALPSLIATVSDALELVYLDGIADAGLEDDGELVDGRTRSERSAGKAADAIMALLPFIRDHEERRDEFAVAVGVLWRFVCAFTAACEVDARDLVAVIGPSLLRDLDALDVLAEAEAVECLLTSGAPAFDDALARAVAVAHEGDR